MAGKAGMDVIGHIMTAAVRRQTDIGGTSLSRMLAPKQLAGASQITDSEA